MRLLIICQYYYPEQFLINEIAPELVKHGHDVTVLTGLPNYPEGVVLQDYRHKLRRHEVINGVEIIRCFELGRGIGNIRLLLNYISFVMFGKKTARVLAKDKTVSKFDIVVSYQLSPITMMSPAVEYKRLTGVPLFLYCLDIWPESAKAHVRNANGRLYQLICDYSSKMYKQCDRIAVTSMSFVDYLHDTDGVDKDKLCYIPQHADDNFISMNLSAPDNGVADFMYAGNLGTGQVLDVIILAAEVLMKRGHGDFLIHIVGDGSQRENLQALANEHGVKNKVIFYGQQKRADMPMFYRKADALLITLRGNNAVGNTMPGKLQTYMTTGKPIFGAINGAAKQIIEDADCGACVYAEDVEGLAMLMSDYIDHSNKYVTCGEHAKEYFMRHFTLSVFMEKFEKELTECTNK